MKQSEITKQLIAQLDDVLEQWQGFAKQSKPGEYDVASFLTRAFAAIERITGKSSVYFRQAEERVQSSGGYRELEATSLAGILESLRTDVERGYLRSQEELIHGELFGDFLEMAQYLLHEGYKDAAAVIAGSSLEAHLRQVCHKAGIDTEQQSGGKLVPKKADQLNADLAKANTYSKGDQKNVTAWLGLRNDAAHGHYNKYEAGQVGLLISGVRDFITRNPA